MEHNSRIKGKEEKLKKKKKNTFPSLNQSAKIVPPVEEQYPSQQANTTFKGSSPLKQQHCGSRCYNTDLRREKSSVKLLI